MVSKTSTTSKISSIKTKKTSGVNGSSKSIIKTKSVTETSTLTDEEEFSEWEGLSETPGCNGIVRIHYKQYKDIAQADTESARVEIMKKYIDLSRSEKVLEASMNRASLSAQWAGMEPSKNQLKLQKRQQKRAPKVKKMLKRRR